MIHDVPLMRAATKKASEDRGFLRESVSPCVSMHLQYVPVFVSFQSISICELHCSVGRSVAAL